MDCLVHTQEKGISNDRDEIFILYQGKTPAGREGNRLPLYLGGDDYYEFTNGDVRDADGQWTNQDQAPVGRPVIWTGRLAPGQSADFVVTIMEQDNGDLSTIKSLLGKAVDAAKALAKSNAEAEAIVGVIAELVPLLPDIKGSEFLGAFAVHAENDRGALKANFLKLQGDITLPASGNIPAALEGREHARVGQVDCVLDYGAHYRVYPAVRIGPRLPVRYYLSREVDRCSAGLLAVEGGPDSYKGFYHLGKGQSAWVPLADRRFAWYCDTSKEWATAPQGTNLVHVYRSASDDRKITWYCYKEQPDFRPKYRPSDTKVKVGTEIDQCSQPLLAVAGDGGFYHLAKGQEKWVPIPDRRFAWYCDTSLEHATAPEETNLLLVKRDPNSRQITWECYRETVSLKPYVKPNDTKVLLSREIDQCSENQLTVFGDGGFYLLRKGENKWVPISDRRFRWLCSTSQEASTAPEGTNLLRVFRDPNSRQITWECYHSLTSTAPYHKPDTKEVFLGTEVDRCGDDRLTVEGANGRVVITKGQSGVPVPVASNRFYWYCGDSQEATTAPQLTNLVKVSRERDGRKITWDCFLRR
jgi:hypothetical protein